MTDLCQQHRHHQPSFLGFLSSSDPSGFCKSTSTNGGIQQQQQQQHLLFKEYFVREINALLWISLITITALLLRKIYVLFRLWAKGRRIPGPPCPSFCGHSKLISSDGSGGHCLIDYLANSHKKYGSIVRLWLGPTQLLVSVKDPVLIEEMLVKAEDKLPLTGKAFRLAFGQSSLFVPSFEKVQKRRETLATQLNGNLLERANSISSKVVDCVMGRIDSIMAKGILDCKSVSQHLAFSVLGATFFGDSFLDWSSATVYEELLMMIAKDACFWASYNVLPFWKRGYWKYRFLCARLRRLTQDIVQLCRQNYKLAGDATHSTTNKYANLEMQVEIDPTFSPNDVMTGGLFLEDFNGHLNPVEEPCGNIMGMMFHGCLTTAGLISSIFTQLVMHPDIQEKIYAEIVSVRKDSSKAEAHDIQKMHFLLATVYESARLLPAGPLLQRCSLKRDLNLKGGIMVPAGAIMVVPVQLVQMDDSSWGNDANQFNPYRFFSKATQKEHADSEQGTSMLDDPNNNAAFLPFGSGTRACVGQKFTILGITTLLASLLEQYELKLKSGSGNDPKPKMNDCVLQLLPSPKIVFVKREN